jgi:hypothetical protein
MGVFISMNERLIKKIFKIISEQTVPEVNRVIVKLFHMLDAEKKQSKTRKELLDWLITAHDNVNERNGKDRL